MVHYKLRPHLLAIYGTANKSRIPLASTYGGVSVVLFDIDYYLNRLRYREQSSYPTESAYSDGNHGFHGQCPPAASSILLRLRK